MVIGDRSFHGMYVYLCVCVEGFFLFFVFVIIRSGCLSDWSVFLIFVS